ncbi:MAG: PilZ domain-containing protein [Sphingobium sp.]
MNDEDPNYAPAPGADQHVLKSRPTRTNLLLSGTIEAADIKGPVRIRNLSETGALLEGAALPAVGHHLVLRRLQMDMGATVVWAENGRCGIRFDGAIAVAGWREGNWIAPVVSSDQARADSIQAAARAGLLAASQEDAAGPVALTRRDIDRGIASELTALKDMLEKASEQLSEVPAVMDLHGETLQNFDLACQTLGHLAALLRAEGSQLAVAAIGMEALRERLERRSVSRDMHNAPGR